jgi:hypothetical protein
MADGQTGGVTVSILAHGSPKPAQEGIAARALFRQRTDKMNEPTSAFPARLTAILLAAARAPWRMVALAAVLVVAAVVSITLTFTMTTDTGELISAKTRGGRTVWRWRRPSRNRRTRSSS